MIEQVLAAIKSCRYAYATEAELQEALDRVLTQAGFTVDREVILSSRDRIDLVVNETIGIEVKVAGTTRDVARQLDRYAEHRRLSGLILVTSKNRHGMACRKSRRIPTRLVSLAGGGL